MNQLAIKLKKKRIDSGLTQKQVASQIHIAQSLYSNIENNGSVTLINLVKVAKFLEIEVKIAYELYTTNLE